MIESVAWAMVWGGFVIVAGTGIAWACIIPEEDRISGE